MKKQEKQELLNNLFKANLIFIDFFTNKYGSEYLKYGIVDPYGETKKLIQKAYESGDLKILRAGNNDFMDQVREMPIKDANELSAILKKELGKDLTVLEKMRLTNIQKIIKKGKIITDEEYYLVRERTEEIYNDVNHRNELEELNALIIEFDESKSKR